jgi:hypothetical protein
LKGTRSTAKKKAIQFVFPLSTGYEVEFEFTPKRFEGMDHLTQALIGEILLPKLKTMGLKKAFNHIQKEIEHTVCQLPVPAKDLLLSYLIWQAVIEKYGQLEKAIRRKKPQ